MPALIFVCIDLKAYRMGVEPIRLKFESDVHSTQIGSLIVHLFIHKISQF